MKKVIQEEIYLDAKITDIFRLIENYENYEKFVPGCKSSSKKVISESVSQGTLNFEFLNKRYRFVSLNNSSEDRIQMKQLEGPFKSFLHIGKLNQSMH